MKEVNVGGRKNAGNGRFAALYCTIFRAPSYRKSLKFFGTYIASLDPETDQLPAFSTLSAMFTESCGPPEKLSAREAINVQHISSVCDLLLSNYL